MFDIRVIPILTEQLQILQQLMEFEIYKANVQEVNWFRSYVSSRMNYSLSFSSLNQISTFMHFSSLMHSRFMLYIFFFSRKEISWSNWHANIVNIMLKSGIVFYTLLCWFAKSVGHIKSCQRSHYSLNYVLHPFIASWNLLFQINYYVFVFS